MNKRKPFSFYFRLRPNKQSTYRQVYFRLRIGNSKEIDSVTGVFVELDKWKPRLRNPDPLTRLPVLIDKKLAEIEERVQQIYLEQQQRAENEGWQVTSRSVLRQFQGLPPVFKVEPIQPCTFSWTVVCLWPDFTHGIRRAVAYA